MDAQDIESHMAAWKRELAVGDAQRDQKSERAMIERLNEPLTTRRETTMHSKKFVPIPHPILPLPTTGSGSPSTGTPPPPSTMTVIVYSAAAGTFSASVTLGAEGTGPNGYYGGYTSGGYPVIEIYVQQNSSGVWEVTWYYIASGGHEYTGFCTKVNDSRASSPLGDYTGTSSTATATSP